MLPLVVIDYRVLCHHLVSIQEKHQWYPSQEELMKKSCAYLVQSAPNLFPVFDAQVVMVDDVKSPDRPYWRKAVYPAYKGNRPDSPRSGMSLALSTLAEYVKHPKSGIQVLSSSGNEADDWAGALVKYKLLTGNPRPIYLYTVDSDWLQLVGPGVTWVDLGPYLPAVRNHSEVLAWAKKRLKVDIQHPREIVDIKMKQGDKSDNLPKDSPRYMIDLLAIPSRYDPLTHFWGLIEGIFREPVMNRNLKHLETSNRWLMSQGISVRPF